MQKSGLFDLIPEFVRSKVYAGISAGSMIAGQSLALSSQALNNEQAFIDDYYDELGPRSQSAGEVLKLANLIFRPHLNSRYFSKVRKDLLEKRCKKLNLKYPVYALDDSSALKIVDDKIEVVTEGEWLKLDSVGVK